ncbi:unnamed protein product [Pleuronectes platessa]|uniref:Uncharacterized protein n=1 Tax=Pleuronectes platessa TaxID=8262 RepID=A0A9N7ZCZ7_PLEPL|nr:unnamed protein product [Pleuronectes platessa]
MAPMEEFSTFMWMDLSEIPDWNDVEGCIRHLAEKGVAIDDAKCFDQSATDSEKHTEAFRKIRAVQKALRGAPERPGEGIPRQRRRSYLSVSVKTEKHKLAFRLILSTPTVQPMIAKVDGWWWRR